MTTPTSARAEMRSSIFGALAAAGVIPPADCYAAVRREITELGRTRFHRLERLVGPRALSAMLRLLRRPYPEDDCIRVLGFGEALTRFVVAPVGIDGKALEAVVDLGASANFLVSAYDCLVDSGVMRSRALPHGLLDRVLRQNGWWSLAVLETIGALRSRALPTIAADYLRRLNSCARFATSSAEAGAIRRVIWRMYEAEVATLGRDTGERMLRRKSALPFVTMGLPGWLVVSDVRARMPGWHVKWLYRVGEFFGWLDDVVDLPEDIVMERPNRARAFVGESPDTIATVLSETIITLGRRIMVEWRERTSDSEQLPAHVRSAFGVCAASWLGGGGAQT